MEHDRNAVDCSRHQFPMWPDDGHDSGQVSPVLSVVSVVQVVPSDCVVPTVLVPSAVLVPSTVFVPSTVLVSPIVATTVTALADSTALAIPALLALHAALTIMTITSPESFCLSERPFRSPALRGRASRRCRWAIRRRALDGRSSNHASPAEQVIIDSPIIRAIDGVASRPLEMEPSKARAKPEEIKPRNHLLLSRSHRAYLPQIVPIVPEDS